ncbi:MAG TPA: alpha/beta hydrolase [Hyphomonas atlantica]|uniref:Alpha/beta hydrolase n=1 Tax=Hyphomonas atlantica TaxID=1280948 RepID=A0A356W7V0_9PROT|nr:alpha/beta hydrolase [Hyphomonas atlantica]
MRAPFLATLALILATGCDMSDTEQLAPAPKDTSTPTLMSWADLLSRDRPTTPHTIRTGPRDADIVDLWLPDGDGPHPVVIMVHGGCWQKSVADHSLMDFAAEDLRQKGFAVWNIEYRGVDEDGGGYPGTFEDVAHAADALREHADTYNLKIDRIGAFGHSAGGHLALWLAARPKLPKSSPLWQSDPLHIDLVVNSGGLADLEASAPVTLESCLSAIMDDLTGAASGGRPDVFSDTSPAELLPFAAHQFSVNGALDQIAPPILGEEYSNKAKAAGSDARSILVLETGHVELIAPGSDAFELQAEILLTELSD